MIINKKITKIISVFISLLILFTSCVSTTWIRSEPTGAKVFINDEYVGDTPYSYSDKKIIDSRTTIKLEKENFKVLRAEFFRDEEMDVGPVIAGCFLLVPFLWTYKYFPSHNYILEPLSQAEEKVSKKENIKEEKEINSVIYKDKTQQLLDLKKLLDAGVLTQEEFDKEKKKILDKD